MASIIRAIINLLENPIINLNSEYVNSRNRANNMGAALEEYIKDLFAGTVNLKNEERLKIHSELFSYGGNQNNPPDFMIREGDAVEVKKLENPTSEIALNSSYPKNKLYSSSLMINKKCRECESWQVKDQIYAIGAVGKDKETLTTLTMIYGDDYCAEPEVYEKIKTKISDGVLTIPDVEFAPTKELGRVNRVDPLGITSLRIRGMWSIQNPLIVYRDYYKPNPKKAFNFMALINKNKWETFPDTSELLNIINKTECAEIKTVWIKDPNNTVNLRECYLITFGV